MSITVTEQTKQLALAALSAYDSGGATGLYMARTWLDRTARLMDDMAEGGAFHLWLQAACVDGREPPIPPVAAASYPHDDDRCRQASVDAEGFRRACRALAELAEALGLSDSGHGVDEIVSLAAQRLGTEAGR
jgi:hypothetical protein